MELKRWSGESIYSAAMETQTKRTGLWTQGGEGEGGMNGEICMDTYTLTYVKQIVTGNVLHDSGNSNRGSVTT